MPEILSSIVKFAIKICSMFPLQMARYRKEAYFALFPLIVLLVIFNMQKYENDNTPPTLSLNSN